MESPKISIMSFQFSHTSALVKFGEHRISGPAITKFPQVNTSLKSISFENLIWGRCWVIVNILVTVGLGKHVIAYTDHDWPSLYSTCCNLWLTPVVTSLNPASPCDLFDLRVLKFPASFLAVHILVFLWKTKPLIFSKPVWENVKDLIKKLYFCLIHCSAKQSQG